MAGSHGCDGNFAGTVSLGYVLIFVAIPSVGYLLGMGWFAAKKAAYFADTFGNSSHEVV